jgi:hypothetical protein
MSVLSEEKLSQLGSSFNLCVQGYHLINSDPIKESVWESINAQVLVASGIQVSEQSNGSHSSGSDISCAIGNLSNKSAKYEDSSRASFSISSYRLSSVCSAANCGTIPEIVAEIDKRKNFEYYSVIVREEDSMKYHYTWYLIPSDYAPLNPHSYDWAPSIGKRGANKGKQVGWETNTVSGSTMKISFSMSSQLWMHLAITEDMDKFVVGRATAPSQKRYNYIELFGMLSKSPEEKSP